MYQYAIGLFLLLYCSGVITVAAAKDPGETLTNQSLEESLSPYLRDHVNDAIQWQTLSTASLNKAQKEHKPILLSSGYQACYWCYRMKQDTFSQQAIGELVNKHFVAILIDRDLQPELDAQLQRFMNDQNGFGGWPLNVILTPSGNPVVGLSYASADNFSITLQRFLDTWKTDTTKVNSLADKLGKRLFSQTQKDNLPLSDTNLAEIIKALLEQIQFVSDETHGGFGEQEKFPNIPQLNALLDMIAIQPDDHIKQFVQLSLNNMLNGGLLDHLGGGFFRYTTLPDWREPHYEQMLFTQALMVKLLIRAASQFDQPVYATHARFTLEHLLEQFRHPDGFYQSALSAFSNKINGGYYLWQTNTLTSLLGKDWQDYVEDINQSSVKDKTPTILPKLTGKDAIQTRQILLKHRQQRPLTKDDKQLLGWNALVLSALAYGTQLSDKYKTDASQLAKRLHTHVTNGLSLRKNIRRLLNNTKSDTIDNINISNQPAKLEDYVYTASAFIDWWQVSHNDDYLILAKKLLLAAYQQFYKEPGWHSSQPLLILNPPGKRAIEDTQLPSPSALWLSLAHASSQVLLKDHKAFQPSLNNELSIAVESVSKHWPQGFKQRPYFYASSITALVAMFAQHAYANQPNQEQKQSR